MAPADCPQVPGPGCLGSSARTVAVVTPGGRLLQAESTKNLSATFLGILDEFRQRYPVSYSPRGVVKDGWHRPDVRVNRKGTVVKARPGVSREH